VASGDHGVAGIGLRRFALPAVIAALVAMFGALTPEFLSARNFSMLLIETSITAILAVGMLLVILPGYIDLSAGSGVGLTGGLAAVLIQTAGWPAPVAMAVPLVLAIIVWMSMGFLIMKKQIQAFIVTLGGLLIFKGLFWLTIRSTTVPVSRGGETNLMSSLATSYLPEGLGIAIVAILAAVCVPLVLRSNRRFDMGDEKLRDVSFLKAFVACQASLLLVLLCNQHRGVPLSFLILIAVASVLHVVTSCTPFGRYLVAIGGNTQAAVLCGIPVTRVVVASYGILGAIIALTGFMQTSYAGASTVSVGDLMELDAIAACVIGGTSLRGGRGTVLGTLLGATLMSVLLNGMTLMAVDPEIKFIVRGGVLVAAVLMDVGSRRER
jgi:D-xylose transport system permease protein